MIHLIRCEAVALHRKCKAISVSRPHMFTAPSGVPPESESVSSNVCSQQPLLRSCAGYWGLHKLNQHGSVETASYQLRVYVRACVTPPVVPLTPWQLKHEHLQRFAPWGVLFCIIIKDTYGSVKDYSAACVPHRKASCNEILRFRGSISWISECYIALFWTAYYTGMHPKRLG